MRRFFVLRMLKYAVLAVIFVSAIGYAVMLLWNLLLPPLTGWRAIGFGQALALLVLCRILFGGVRGHGGWHARRHFRERLARMTPEERARLRVGLGVHCRRQQPSGENTL